MASCLASFAPISLRPFSKSLSPITYINYSNATTWGLVRLDFGPFLFCYFFSHYSHLLSPQAFASLYWSREKVVDLESNLIRAEFDAGTGEFCDAKFKKLMNE